MFPDVTVNNFGDILSSLRLAVFQRGKEYLISVVKHEIHRVDSGLYLCGLRFIFEHTQMVMYKIF